MKKTLLKITLIFSLFFLYQPNIAAAGSCKCQGTVYDEYNRAMPGEECFRNVPNTLIPVVTDAQCERIKTESNERSEYVPDAKNWDQCVFYADDNCGQTSQAQTSPSALENLQADLSARKPILEINIPGLNFSDVASSTDETGTYFYIAWIPELISALYKFLLAIVSIVAVVVIIIQGLRVIGSGGGEGKTTAYKKILQSVIGLFIAWGSYAILYNINPALVQFNALKIKVVEPQELQVSTSDEDPNDTRAVAVPERGNVPYFGQYDPRWGKLKPGDLQWPFNTSICNGKLATITERGCGPTSMAMVLKYLGKDVTPIDTAKFSLGCFGAMSPSLVNKNWSKSPWSDLKFEAYVDSSRALALAAQNLPIIIGCHPCIGFTIDTKILAHSGHFMVITGSTDGGQTFQINDPGARNGIVIMTRDQILDPQREQAIQGCNSKSDPKKRLTCLNNLKEMRKPNFYYIHK